MNYKCLILDDEKLARELLESYISKIPNLEVLGSCGNALEGMRFLAQKKVDILFLDIQMPHFTGIELLKTMSKIPPTILTTANSEFALESYDLGVVDYLLKPIEFSRFIKSVSRALIQLEKTGDSVELIPEVYEQENKEISDYCFLKSQNKIVRVQFDDILFIEALQKYIRIHTKDKKITTLLSLSKILNLLPSSQFVRIHRSYIINIPKIENIEGNRVTIKEKELPISKGQKEVFMNLLRQKGLLY